MNKKEKYYNYVVDDLEKNTHRPSGSVHYYVFDCNVSVHMNHGSVRPYFMWVPVCFEETLVGWYGLHLSEVESIFDIYSEYLIERYLLD